MHPLLIASLVLSGIMVLVMPYYCKITFDGQSKKTLTVKMFLSSLFVLTAILSLFSVKARHGYMYVMLLGFVMGFVGDYLLGRSDHLRDFLIGTGFFAAGHLSYIVAFSLAMRHLYPAIGWWNGAEIGLYVVLVCAVALILVLKKPKFHKLLVILFVYFMLIALMVTKAAGLGVRMLGEAPAMAMLPVGAALFLGSDYMLGMMHFKMHERTLPYKSVCSAIYFFGQQLIALSMFSLIQY